jgi:hypothetical protein
MKTRHWLIVSGLAALLALGCQEDEIRHYRVPRAAETGPPAASPTRLLAAIFPRAEESWVFRLSGPAAQVNEHAAAFDQFVRTVRLSDKGDPPITWTLPEGWKREPGNQFLYATLRMGPGDSAPALTVSHLTGPGASSIKANVERWAKQLELKEVSEEDLAKYCHKVPVNGVDAMFVDITGTGSGKMTPPFAKGGLPKASEAPAPPRPNITYTKPESWKEFRDPTGIALAAFHAGEGAGRVDITVTSLPGSAGGLLANIKRWRGQIGMPPASDTDVGKEIRDINVAGMPAQMVDLLGPDTAGVPRQRIVGIILTQKDATWFFKMKGPADAAAREQGAFEAFVGTVKFGDK